MIPNIPTLSQPIETPTTISSRTYKLQIGLNRISGWTDGLSAVQQAAYLILNTERYKFDIYSWNYGSEFEDLYGRPRPLVQSELERRVREALMVDDRITNVNNFQFKFIRDKVYCTFTVTSIYGTFDAETEVTA